MENPATWTPLHHEIDTALCRCGGVAQEVLNVLHSNGYNEVTLDQVKAVIDEHDEDLRAGVCGFSLPAKIVCKLAV